MYEQNKEISKIPLFQSLSISNKRGLYSINMKFQ